MSAVRYPCPCCGYRTLPAPAPGSEALCPVCGWEDAAYEGPWSGSNAVDLREAQLNFAALGACEAMWLDAVRAPTAAEARAPDWRTVAQREAQARDAVRGQIAAAFGDLRRGDGMRVYEAELADDYGVESERSAARKGDTYQRWTEIAPAIIEEHYSVLSFFDAQGLRLHLAAYMTWALDSYLTSDSCSVDFTIYALDVGGSGDELRGWQFERYALFDDAQRRATAAFLRFMVEHAGEAVDARVAKRALVNYWGRFEG